MSAQKRSSHVLEESTLRLITNEGTSRDDIMTIVQNIKRTKTVHQSDGFVEALEAFASLKPPSLKRTQRICDMSSFIEQVG